MQPDKTEAQKWAKELLSQMTLPEKVAQLMQISCQHMSMEDVEMWVRDRAVGSVLHAVGEDALKVQRWALQSRLKIPVLYGIDAVHGHALHNGAQVYPSPLAMACSFDAELLEKVARATAMEVAEDGIHWTFSPLLCLARDTRWGRVGETFGEDGYLAGEMGAAMVRGYQGKDLQDDGSIMACAKHYIAYGEANGGRDSYDAQISMRKVRETFLPPFKRVIEEGCASVMTAYHAIDGTPCTANHEILNQILRSELGFDGLLVTDWDNVRSLVTKQLVCETFEQASKATLETTHDLIMYSTEFYDATIALVKEGALAESVLDDAVMRMLLIKYRIGLITNPKKVRTEQSAAYQYIGCEAHRRLGEEASEKSIVLLKNNGVLPLNADESIFLTGPNADDELATLGDWSFFTHPCPDFSRKPKDTIYTLRRGLQAISANFTYRKGCDLEGCTPQQLEEAILEAKKASVSICVVGDGFYQMGEHYDRSDLSLPESQRKLLETLKENGNKLIVVLLASKPLCLDWAKEHADAIVCLFNPGQQGGLAFADMLFGKTQPEGKLPISFPRNAGQIPVYYNQLPGWHAIHYCDLPKGPLYTFGDGMSYTTYQYSRLTLSSDCAKEADTITVSVDVTNTGSRDGTEIVQLYIHDRVASILQPVLSLKDFARVQLKKGETKTITFRLPIQKLAIVNAKECTVVEKGMFDIYAGPSADITKLLCAPLKVE